MMLKTLWKRKKSFTSITKTAATLGEMMIYFEDENRKSKKKNNWKNVTTIKKPVHTSTGISSTVFPVAFSVAGHRLSVIPVSTGEACGVTISIRVHFGTNID